MAVEFTISYIKNIHQMAWRQAHFAEQTRVPGTYYNSAAVWVRFQKINGPLNLVVFFVFPLFFLLCTQFFINLSITVFQVWKTPPEYRVNRPYIAIFAGPCIPYM